MDNVLTALCMANGPARSVVLAALHGVSRCHPLCETIADETADVLPGDIRQVVRMLRETMHTVAKCDTEAELCVALINYSASLEVPMTDIYRFVALVCIQDKSDALRHEVLSSVADERAHDINALIAEIEGTLPRPMPARRENPFASLIEGALRLCTTSQAAT